jgi:hypothetical protein
MRIGPYRFFFYAAELGEPPHVHVGRDRQKAKYWLKPVRLSKWTRFGHAELNRLEQLVKEHREYLLEAWDEHFEV